MSRNKWLLLSIVVLVLKSSIAFAGVVVTGANATLDHVVMAKTTAQFNVATAEAKNATLYWVTLDVDDNLALKNTVSINPYGADITIATGKTVSGTSNLFGDAAKAGAGTYTNVAGTVWSKPTALSVDFTLKPGSPAIDAGTPLWTAAAYPGDFIGTSEIYGRAPDIGAYEYKSKKSLFPVMPVFFSKPDKCKTTDSGCYLQP